MKKILYNLFLISSIFMMIFFSTENVYAVQIKKEASGWYYERDKKNGGENYSGTLQNYTLNGEVAYCIEPTASDDGSVSLSDWSKTGLSNKIKERILLIGYYGYTYPGHKTKKYRAATQCMIWEAIMGEGSWCKVNTKHWSAGTNIDLSAERKEINRLIKEHHKTVSFNGEVHKVQVGETLELTDTNNVLSNFEITADNIDYSVKDNKLSMKPVNDKATISFKKNQIYNSDYKIFVGNKVQNQLIPGNVDPTLAKIEINTYNGRVELNKEDSEAKVSQGEATLEGAVYGIYNKETNELITKITTDKNGVATSENVLEYGSYYLKELEASKGYLLDTNIYDFDLKGKDSITLNVKENVIKAKLDITKLYVPAKTGIANPESNVKFELYNSSNEKLYDLETDENGKFNIILPYGKYRLHQVTTKKGYQYVDDVEIEINSADTINKVLSDKEVTAKLKVIKVDSETKKVIKRSNIKFKIYDINNKEYVCQMLNDKKICEYKTNSSGVMITPQILYSGKYKLVEVDEPIDGYTWNKESIEFEIDEKSNLITDNENGILFETKFENKRVTGTLEITKLGEELSFNENGYEYKKTPLKGVKIGLFKDNKLLKEYETSEEGKIKINNLELGKYTLKELSTIGDHLLSEKEYIVNIKYKDQYTDIVNYKITINNYLPKGTLEFTKTNISKSKALPNTLMEIYRSIDDKLIFSGKTDENGKIVITDLPIGKYYLLEKKAPKGYVINPNRQEFEILENGQIVQSEMQDDMIVKVPITDKIVIPDYVYPVALIIIGIGLIVYASNKKKK